MIDINFLNESISSYNEGLIFSTEKGRKQCINVINKVDLSIKNISDSVEKSSKIILNIYANIFRGNIAENTKNKLPMLKKANIDLDKIYNDMNNKTDEIRGDDKLPILKQLKHDMKSNKADFKKDEVITRYQGLFDKCSSDGEYSKKINKAYLSINNNIYSLIINSVDKIKDSVIELPPDSEGYAQLRSFISNVHKWKDQNKLCISILNIINDNKIK